MSNLPEMPKVPTSPWREFLQELDERLTEPVELHCLGGFVVSEVYGFGLARLGTRDIDYTAVDPTGSEKELEDLAGRDSPLAARHRVYLQRVGVDDVPVDYKTRLGEIFPDQFTRLRLMVLDPYDLVLSKLTRNFPIDMKDAQFLARELDLDGAILKERYSEELRPYIMTGRLEKHDLTLQLWLDEYFSQSG